MYMLKREWECNSEPITSCIPKVYLNGSCDCMGEMAGGSHVAGVFFMFDGGGGRAGGCGGLVCHYISC